jgi:hypothetical protein
MLHHVALVITDILEEHIASIIRVTQIVFLHSVLRLLVTANVLSSTIVVTLMMEVTHSSGKSVLTRSTQGNIPGSSRDMKLTTLLRLAPRSRMMELCLQVILQN